MPTKRPVHPILIVLPVVAFTLTVIALASHAATGDEAYYRGALFASLGGLAIAVCAALAGLLDAVSLPRFTVARVAGFRQAAFTTLGLILFVATATATSNRYEGRAVGDAVPLALGAVGLVAIAIAGWYGRVVQLAFRLGQTVVWYPRRMMEHLPSRRALGSARTIV